MIHRCQQISATFSSSTSTVYGRKGSHVGLPVATSLWCSFFFVLAVLNEGCIFKRVRHFMGHNMTFLKDFLTGLSKFHILMQENAATIVDTLIHAVIARRQNKEELDI